MTGSPHSQRLAVATGAACGFGAGVAKRLATDGFAVALLDLDASACQAVVSEIRAVAGQAGALVVDVADEAATQDVVDGIVASLGEPTVLIDNAGIIRGNLLIKMTVEDSGCDERAPAGLIPMLTAAQAAMTKVDLGRIAQLSSTSALGYRGRPTARLPRPGRAGSHQNAGDRARHVRCHRQCHPHRPQSRPEINKATAERMGVSFDFVTVVVSDIPVGRGGLPVDIADAVSFFASARAGFVLGQVLYAAGGPKA